MSIPLYLRQRLAAIDLEDVTQIRNLGYLTTFCQLKAQEPSLGYLALFDLYRLCHELSEALPPDLKQSLISEYKQAPPTYPRLDPATIQHFLAAAHAEASKAGQHNEVPIGAVVVSENIIIGRGYNQTRTLKSASGHAEIIALREAEQKLANFRLTNCDLYVTVEPCLMCAGAIIHSRIRRLIYASAEPKTGACHSQYQVFNNKTVNHHTQVIGPLPDYAKQILTTFFKNKRK